MYLPPHFREDNLPELQRAIGEARLAVLITSGPQGIVASHLPMLFDPTPLPNGRLLGHVARANPQWRGYDGMSEALAIFPGPEAYISPAWYATKRATGKVVPTWNYVAVHAYGRLEFFDDAVRLRSLVGRLTERQESRRPTPWAVDDAPKDYIDAQLKAIVGFEMAIQRLEGKWKLSQNRPAEDRAGTIAGLKEEGGPAEQAVAALMSDREKGN
jgi:transcriptional regulator